MTDYTYSTGNPIGSTDVRDGVDNLKSFDVLLNSTDDTYQDRLGTTVPTAAGAIKRLGPVRVDWTFTTGGMLNYPNEAALNPADGNFYGWTGAFPHVVAPGTDPTAVTGYVPRTDAVLRIELAGESGGDLVHVGSASLSSQLSINVKRFGAHPITEAGYETFDSTQAFQDAIDEAIATGVGVVEYEGKYLIDTALWYFETPGDDGTVYPGWVGAGDVNIAPETTYQIPCCLRIAGNVKLKAKSKETDILVGSWDHSTADLNQKALLLITAGSKYEGTIRYALEDIAVQDFFIGRIVECTAEASYEQIKFIGCGFPGIIQGVERRYEGYMEYSVCYTGDIHGGWWTQRNSTSRDASYLPPYPASDVWAVGWTDACNTENLTYTQTNGAFGAVHQAIDAFFDMYFYKQANSARQSAGGRLSNNDAPNPAVITNYRGVVGRARTVLSRYGRTIANYTIGNLKTLGTHRTPVFYSPGRGSGVSASSVGNCYIERCGLINNTTTSTTSNKFGIDNQDAYRDAGYGVGYYVAYGPEVERVLSSSGNQQAPTHDGRGLSIAGSLNINRAKYAAAEESPWPYFFECSVSGDAFDVKYLATEDYLFTQPLRFGSQSAEDFNYVGLTSFSPTITSGGVSVPFMLKNGRYRKVGKAVQFFIDFYNPTQLTFTAGSVVVSGLPFSLGTSPNSAHVVTVNILQGLTAGLTVQGRISGSTIMLFKDSAGTMLSGADCNNSVSESVLRMSGFYFIN